MLAVLSIIFIAIGIVFMYVGIRICRVVWFAHEWLLVFVIFVITRMNVNTIER